MKKTFRYILIFFSIIGAIAIIGRITGAWQYYSIPTLSNFPNIKTGSKIVASNLINPKRFDFICFEMTLPEFGKQIWVHRLCGLEGDKIEIRNGDLYINGQKAAIAASLAHMYYMSFEEFEKLQSKYSIEENMIYNNNGDSVYLNLPEKAIVEHSVKARKYIMGKADPDKLIQQQFSANWNLDHFGPITVPPGKYFVLGDNRHSARDSRFVGFIDKANWVGTVIGK